MVPSEARERTTTKNQLWDVLVFPKNKGLSHWIASQWSTRATVRGPPGSTIIIYKELIRFNNNNKQDMHTLLDE